MTARSRIERLEKRVPARLEKQFGVDLDFRVAGKSRQWVQGESIRRLQAGIADPRATDEQREYWRSLIERFEIALKQWDR